MLPDRTCDQKPQCGLCCSHTFHGIGSQCHAPAVMPCPYRPCHSATLLFMMLLPESKALIGKKAPQIRNVIGCTHTFGACHQNIVVCSPLLNRKTRAYSPAYHNGLCFEFTAWFVVLVLTHSTTQSPPLRTNPSHCKCEHSIVRRPVQTGGGIRHTSFD